jgi:hypothetical protein
MLDLGMLPPVLRADGGTAAARMDASALSSDSTGFPSFAFTALCTRTVHAKKPGAESKSACCTMALKCCAHVSHHNKAAVVFSHVAIRSRCVDGLYARAKLCSVCQSGGPPASATTLVNEGSASAASYALKSIWAVVVTVVGCVTVVVTVGGCMAVVGRVVVVGCVAVVGRVTVAIKKSRDFYDPLCTGLYHGDSIFMQLDFLQPRTEHFIVNCLLKVRLYSVNAVRLAPRAASFVNATELVLAPSLRARHEASTAQMFVASNN